MNALEFDWVLALLFWTALAFFAIGRIHGIRAERRRLLRAIRSTELGE